MFRYLLSGNTTAKTNEATGKTFGEVKLKQIYLSFDLFNLREEECKTPLENMVYILKNMNLFDMSPFKEKNNDNYQSRLITLLFIRFTNPSLNESR